MTELHTTAISYTVNGRDSTPQSFYTVACNPQRHVVVEACAGAGKTWMLVARIGRALLADAPAHSILAITFTNKAAAEMRGRVADLLALWATLNNNLLAQELLARGVPQTAINDALLNKARGLQAEVLAGRGLAIRTFHGWFASLLRMAPLSLMKSLGLPSPYELLLDDAQAVALVWPQFYKAVYADVQLRTDFALALAANGRSNVHDALAFALSKRVEISLASDATLLNGVASVAQTVAAFADCRHIDQALDEMSGMANALREASVSMTGSGNPAYAGCLRRVTDGYWGAQTTRLESLGPSPGCNCAGLGI
ncbi:MAG: UvrD-helicase domain-containing protein [Burkholderiaceae bacterium]